MADVVLKHDAVKRVVDGVSGARAQSLLGPSVMKVKPRPQSVERALKESVD